MKQKNILAATTAATTKPGVRRKKLTEYGQQLVEKQKLRQAYGMREKQFRRYFDTAAKNKQQTGRTLLALLERRLDNVIFRVGLAESRKQARQLVSHRHFKLNDRRVSTPSALVVVGDKISPATKKVTQLKEFEKISWLKFDKMTQQVEITALPDEASLPLEYDTQKIIELYSR